MSPDARRCPSCQKPLPEAGAFCPHCGLRTPTEPGVPARTAPTGAHEISRLTRALADRYRIERVLGEGGMATVYLAEDLKHHRRVAVKVMRPELVETLGAERFLREVEIAARLSHPNILPVFDSGESSGFLYYVMPYIEGESLPERLAREKQLPVQEALAIAREVGEALAYAHQQGIVHRDIKPANILLSAGHALVADFGIARATASGGQTLTKTGLAIGTPQYMSPEQASGESNIDGRTDVYALGCVLYEMIAGEPPFTGPTAQAVIARALSETPRSLEQTRDGLSPVVSSVVLRAMAKRPADRHQTAAEFVTAVSTAENAVRGGATTATPKPLGWRRLAAVAVVLVALGAGVASIFRLTGAAAPGNDGPIRLAILPFENQGNPDDAYFGDGIVDEVRGKLARIDGITVIASNSADQYRGTDKPTSQVASELGADYLLVGKVRWMGGAGSTRRVQVVPELIDARTGGVTWGEPFDATLTDLFQMQATMAARVAGALGRVLGRGEADLLAERPTSNAEAYDLFLQARAIRDNGAVAQRRAARLLEQAVALDSTFADAWSELSIVWSRVYANGQRELEAGERSGVAAQRALALKPGAAGPHLANARYLLLVRQETEAALVEFDRTVSLEPNNADAQASAAGAYMGVGLFEKARLHVERARELDPRSHVVLSNHLRILVQLEEFETAKTVGHDVIALSTDDLQSVQDLALAYFSTGDVAGGRSMLREVMRIVPSTELVAYLTGYNETGWMLEESEQQLAFRLTPSSFDGDEAWWGQALAILAWGRGEHERARGYARQSREPSAALSAANPDDGQLRVLHAIMLAYLGEEADAIREARFGVQLTTASSGAATYSALYEQLQLVRVYLALGRNEEALALLETMRESRSPTMGYLRYDPMFDPIRETPRFQALVNAG